MGRSVLHPGTLRLLDHSARRWFLLGTPAIRKLHRDAGEVGEGERLMDLDARYRAYVGWCAKMGVTSADFETWLKIQSRLPESAN